MNNATTQALLSAVANGVRTIELGQPLFNGMPCSPNHPGFRMALARRHGDMVRPDGGSAANEIIVTGGHVGTHIDALSHVSQDGKLHGDVDAERAQRGGRFTEHGAERLPALCTRGVLLDVANTQERDVLAGGYGVTAEDLERAAASSGATPAKGDVALIHTGWARHFDDAQRYLGHDTGVPGITEDAAGWLADHGVVAVGTDTTACERIPAGVGHQQLPVHRVLLVESGIYILENLNLSVPAAEGISEFLFLLAPLRIVGGTGSPVRPVAVVGQ